MGKLRKPVKAETAPTTASKGGGPSSKATPTLPPVTKMSTRKTPAPASPSKDGGRARGKAPKAPVGGKVEDSSGTPKAKPASPVKVTRSGPILTAVVVSDDGEEPEAPKLTSINNADANASPKRTGAGASSPPVLVAVTPTLVPVMVEKDKDTPPPKVISSPSVSKKVGNKQTTKPAGKVIKKKKKKPIKKVPSTDQQTPKLSLSASKSDLIATAVSMLSKKSQDSGSRANVTIIKEPGPGTGIVTVKKVKSKVKSSTPATKIPSSTKKTLPSSSATETKTKTASSSATKIKTGTKPSSASAAKTPSTSGTKPSSSGTASSKTAPQGSTGPAATQAPPPKKKKKFFSEGKPEIKITQVGPAVVVQKKEKEKFSIYKLYHEMRESCIISDRWCIPEPMWDPHTNREVLLCYEVDVLMDGSVRMKRCLKILENFELIVLLDGSDKTHLFKEKHPYIRSSQELLDLIRRVTMVKVCSGIKDCDPTDFDNITTKVIERGGSWYSVECNVEVEKGCLGNICKRCTSLRNTLRRKAKRQFDLDNSTASGGTPQPNRSLLSSSIKPVLRTVGEALYTNLHHMSGGGRYIEDDFSPPLPRSSNQVLHPELQIYMNSELKERLDEIAANPPPPMHKIEHVVEFDPRTMTKTLKRIQTPVLPTSFRNIINTSGGGRSAGSKRMKAEQNSTYMMGNNGELTLVQTPSGETIQLPEGYVLADDGNSWGDNVVVQKIDGQDDQFIVGDDNNIIVGSNFTLEDGEEYEVIGEAASGEGDSIQVLPLANDSNIEIIEVDENMIQLVDENSQPEIQPVDASSDIFKFLQAQSRLHV